MYMHLTTNKKFFHSYIRDRRVGKLRIVAFKLDDDRVLNDTEAMADTFADAFESLYTRQGPDHPQPHIYHGNM